ncbi:MAG: nicotinamide-nucleotide amidohydrolase family protein [Oscillospiraceae bacterium]|nr:nicotinamide-nucleotide amidohydrolase family protein [Oscillospiraceae bacterium]
MNITDVVKAEYGHDDEIMRGELDKAVLNVVQYLMENRKTVATGESLTGGLLSERITSVPGASQVFELGVCTYSDRMKQDLLHVPSGVLAQYGAVSRQTAYAMAEGLMHRSGADLCLSVTGLAGPGGGSADTPVGTVYAGFAYQGQVTAARLRLFEIPGSDRSMIRYMTALCVFQIAEQLLRSNG